MAKQERHQYEYVMNLDAARIDENLIQRNVGRTADEENFVKERILPWVIQFG